MSNKSYGSVVRNNLMRDKTYTPYCGADVCAYGEPRTKWLNGQFHCKCGWVSNFDEQFIAEYRKKWAK